MRLYKSLTRNKGWWIRSRTNALSRRLARFSLVRRPQRKKVKLDDWRTDQRMDGQCGVWSRNTRLKTLCDGVIQNAKMTLCNDLPFYRHNTTSLPLQAQSVDNQIVESFRWLSMFNSSWTYFTPTSSALSVAISAFDTKEKKNWKKDFKGHFRHGKYQAARCLGGFTYLLFLTYC